MSLPIPPLAAASAAKLVQGLARQVSEVTEFDQLLRGASSDSGDTATAKAEAPTSKLMDAIRNRLQGWTGETNSSLRIGVSLGGVTIEGSHPRAAEFEALLSHDSDISDLAQQVYQTTGAVQFSIDLTDESKQGNIQGHFGG